MKKIKSKKPVAKKSPKIVTRSSRRRRQAQER